MLECKNIKPYNSAGQAHGYWEVYYSNGILMFKGDYLNGNHDGYWVGYYYDGTLKYNRFYARM